MLLNVKIKSENIPTQHQILKGLLVLPDEDGKIGWFELIKSIDEEWAKSNYSATWANLNINIDTTTATGSLNQYSKESLNISSDVTKLIITTTPRDMKAGTELTESQQLAEEIANKVIAEEQVFQFSKKDISDIKQILRVIDSKLSATHTYTDASSVNVRVAQTTVKKEDVWDF
jgi:hypothetical protein